MEEDMSRQAYLEGRLRGLYELVAILKETIDSSDSPASGVLLKSIVTHVSKEVESILEDFGGEHPDHPLLEAAAAQNQEIKKAVSSKKEPTVPQMKKQVDQADELMKNLMAFKAQHGAVVEEEEEAR
jgi:hypothetical protein